MLIILEGISYMSNNCLTNKVIEHKKIERKEIFECILMGDKLKTICMICSF